MNEGAKETVLGLANLIAGFYALRIDSPFHAFGVEIPFISQKANDIRTGVMTFLDDPSKAIENMLQGLADTADEEGIAYSVGYVAEKLAEAIAIKKIGEMIKGNASAGTTNNENMREEYLKKFNKSETSSFTSKYYSEYEKYVNSYCSGEGMIGENSYLLLWNKDEIEELNDAYEVKEFMQDCILIGSDGGDVAYGINKDGCFFSVPFIGMSNDEINYLGMTFDDFLQNLYYK